ncbi:MAG: YggS family pyridoxal phosphate-dependent enzyme [Spirulina sp. SIO3F2]|nr:YggS family pyridoxal phosphate-dependent enzyme [Spirulina sp. SIO3F2]
MNAIAERLTQVRSQIPPQVRLIAVSKTFPAEAIRQAYHAGIRDFGESRIQEAAEKQQALADLTDICWHFIGRLQSNKAKKAIAQFDWIHTCDSLKLALRLDRLGGELGKVPKLCLQVKLRPDPNKQGWTPEQLAVDLATLDTCLHLDIQGLMTILPLGLNEREILATFQSVQALALELQQQSWQRVQMQELSMGMSNDYAIAIQAGATMVRLGRIIFGERELLI